MHIKKIYYQVLLISFLSCAALLLFICLWSGHKGTLSIIIEYSSSGPLAYIFLPAIGALYAFGSASWFVGLFLLISIYRVCRYRKKADHTEALLITCLQIHVVSGWCAFQKYDILYEVPAGGYVGQAFYTYILATCTPALQKLVPEILLVFLFIGFILIFPWHVLNYTHIAKKSRWLNKCPGNWFKRTKRLRTYEPALWAQECCSYWYKNTQDLKQV